MVDLNDIRSRTQTAAEYVNGIKEKWKPEVLEKLRGLRLDRDVVDELDSYTDDIVVVYFGASWCKDCREAIPIMMTLEEEIGLEVRVFGTVKTAPLDPDNQWAIPPSPPEIGEWGATAIPWIEIFDKKGERIGIIIEKPTVKPTLEAELLHVLKHK
ncbi:MAG: TlpA family protein disulfide reductase [Candidatus Thorarchaeota archaeon]|jgi:thiol-disulfide isomerase/thioredoxin